MIEQQRLPSLILWGPPGVGKTTLSEIIAHSLSTSFYQLSAVHSGVKDVREVLERITSEQGGIFGSGVRPILFIDEIHRFSKSQQDSLLAAVEQGIVTLIGATTENPSFEVIRPLLSRCQVYTLNPLTDEELLALLQHALTTDELLSRKRITIGESNALLRYAGGDARRALNILELVSLSTTADPLVITDELVGQGVQANPIAFDKGGELHYDIASALIKSIRGSDPDAAIYWLARLIEGGEDPSFIARRLMISASEDIGLANPNALLLATACAETLERIGWPEGRIPLAETVIYLACSEKSNSAYRAIDAALARVRATGNLPVPLHLRNAPTSLMKDLGYGIGYRYAHDYPEHFVQQQYLPDALARERFWQSDEANPAERQMMERQRHRWGEDKES
jgi:ATPase AAA family